MNECEQALEFSIEREDAAGKILKEASEERRRKIEADHAKAQDVRMKAMENLAGTKKRKAEGTDGTGWKRRSNGNETMQILRERNEQTLNLARSKLEIKEKQLEADAKRHGDLIQALQQQQHAQMQNFQMMMMQFQQSQQQQMQQQMQQHSELMLKLFDKLANK